MPSHFYSLWRFGFFVGDLQPTLTGIDLGDRSCWRRMWWRFFVRVDQVSPAEEPVQDRTDADGDSLEVDSWLCHCGHVQDDPMHCDDCGSPPPWGCDCDWCTGDEENEDDEKPEFGVDYF